MDGFIILLRDFMLGIIQSLTNAHISLGGFSVSYMRIVASFLIIGFVANLFWKGVRA